MSEPRLSEKDQALLSAWAGRGALAQSGTGYPERLAAAVRAALDELEWLRKRVADQDELLRRVART